MDPAEDGLQIPQRYWAILTLMVGVALSCLDTALVNVALPRIAKDLNSSPGDSIWVVNAYQLAVMISLLPLAGPNTSAAAPELRFPDRDLVRVDIELIRQLRNRPITLDRRQRHLRLKGRCVVPSWSFGHHRS